MNRREFLQGVAAIGAATVLPKVDVPEPPSGFDKLFASYPSLEIGHGSGAAWDNFGISASEVRAAVKRAVIDALREST